MQRPNVLLLVVDSLRYDVVFGERDCTTPTLDSLAESGICFSQCYSQGISTAPAMTALLTGRYPLDYGGHWYLQDDQPTMPAQFKANGYRTGAIHSNPNVSQLRNFDTGFDTFDANIVPLSEESLLKYAPETAVRYLNKVARIVRKTPYLPADTINEQLLDWIDTGSEPWFLWTQYMDTHGPYLPGNDFTYRNKFRAERLWRKAAVNAPEEITEDEHDELFRNYRLEVKYLDAALGRFLDALERAGHLDETIVVVVGDHGDEFAQHSQYGHGNLPYEELVRVPLIMTFPDGYYDQYSEGASLETRPDVTTPVRCLDVLPTVLDAVDATLSDEMKERMVGESLLPVLEGSATSYEVVVTEKQMRHEDALRFGFRDDRWTFLYDGMENRSLLYDRDEDPREQTDVSEDYPDITDTFRDHLSDRLASIEETSAGIQTPEVTDHPGVQERLRALGYRK
jgi:arylsulfatase A-like enzyme